MSRASLSECGRFVVLHEVQLDRDVFDAFADWAHARGFYMQHAIEFALFSLDPVVYATRKKPPRKRAPRK